MFFRKSYTGIHKSLTVTIIDNPFLHCSTAQNYQRLTIYSAALLSPLTYREFTFMSRLIGSETHLCGWLQTNGVVLCTRFTNHIPPHP